MPNGCLVYMLQDLSDLGEEYLNNVEINHRNSIPLKAPKNFHWQLPKCTNLFMTEPQVLYYCTFKS